MTRGRRCLLQLTVLVWMTLMTSAVFAEPPSTYPALNTIAPLAKTGSGDVAIIVAVEEYMVLPHVGGATANGNDWEIFFEKSLELNTKNIHFLSNQRATRENLLRYAEIAAKSAQPGATVWFVFIGHGAPSKGGEGLLVGSDAQQDPDSLFARSLPQQKVLDILQTGPQAQTVLIVDACFSGRAGDGTSLAPAQPVIPTNIVPTVQPNTVILSAAQSSELAGSLPGEDRPAFSYLLLGALRGWAADSSQTVTAESAQRYVQRALRNIPGRMSQTPSVFGKSDIVLTRSVAEKDPGIVDLMHKLSRGPQPQPRARRHEVDNNRTTNAIPALPEVLSIEGAIGLDVDADVLVAQDNALNLDKDGAMNTQAAIDAWNKVAEMGGENPFREEARKRAEQWREYDEKRKKFETQRNADREKLHKVLPLTSVAENTKVDMIEDYRGHYGEAEIIDLISRVAPEDVRFRLCEPYLRSERGVNVSVGMPSDRDGEPFKGTITVANTVLGTVPATLNLPSCARNAPISVREESTGKIWSGALGDLSSDANVQAEFSDLIQYSIWHDYIWADAQGGPLLGVMYSQMNFPSDFARRTNNAIRGNLELSVGSSWAGHFSLWFEPSVVLPSDDQESVYGINGGVGIMRFSAGRFSFSPLRVGYQQLYGGDLDGLQGITGHAALRFHLGGGLQLRGDGGILAAKMKLNNQDWEGLIWSAGGGLEWGHPILHNGLGSILGGSGDYSSSDDEWTEWSDGSMTFGYQLGGGFLPNQDLIGTYGFKIKGDDYDGGFFMELQGAPKSAGGFDSSNINFRLGMAGLNDDEDIVYELGFVTGYNGFEESSYYMLGADAILSWRMFSQVSLNAYVALNALAIADVEGDTTDELGNVIGRTTTLSPVASYIRWVTPWQLYMSGGVRSDLGGQSSFTGFGELGYLWSLD